MSKTNRLCRIQWQHVLSVLWVRTLGLAQSWGDQLLGASGSSRFGPQSPESQETRLWPKQDYVGPSGRGQAQRECQENGPGDRDQGVGSEARAQGQSRVGDGMGVGRCRWAPGPQCGLSFRPEHRETLEGFREVAPAQSQSERIPHCSSEDRIEGEGHLGDPAGSRCGH